MSNEILVLTLLVLCAILLLCLMYPKKKELVKLCPTGLTHPDHAMTHQEACDRVEYLNGVLVRVARDMGLNPDSHESYDLLIDAIMYSGK